MYSYDTVIFFSHKNISTVKENLEFDFNSLGNWLYQNELIVNYKMGKTEVMFFGTQKRLHKIADTPVTINYNGNTINPTASYK
jgi:hypothetical protein